MKRLIAMVLVTAVTGAAFAQGGSSSTAMATGAKNEKNFMARMEPHWLLFKEISLDFQFKIGSKFSIGPTLALMKQGEGIFYGTKIESRFLMDDRTDRQSYGIRAAYYFSGAEQHSFLMSTFARYSKSEFTSTGNFLSSRVEKGSFEEKSAGIRAGYQWVLGEVITMNVGGGLGYYDYPRVVAITDDGAPGTRTLGSDSNMGYSLDAGVGILF